MSCRKRSMSGNYGRFAMTDNELVTYLAIVFGLAILVWWPGAAIINRRADERFNRALGGYIPVDEPPQDEAHHLAAQLFGSVAEAREGGDG